MLGLVDAEHSVAEGTGTGTHGQMPEPLARKLGVRTGDWVKVSSARGEVVVRAVPTPRMKSLQIDGQEVTIVWMPYNWGFQGLSTGPERQPSHDRRRRSGAGTQETKACLVNIAKAEPPPDRVSRAHRRTS